MSLAAMAQEINALDLAGRVSSVCVPLVFMLGRYDRQLDARQAADYFEALSALDKQLIWFEKSAHNVPSEEPALFAAALKAAHERFSR